MEIPVFSMDEPIVMPDGDKTGCPYHMIEQHRRLKKLDALVEIDPEDILVEHPGPGPLAVDRFGPFNRFLIQRNRRGAVVIG